MWLASPTLLPTEGNTMTMRELLRAPGRAGWAMLALLAYFNHTLYLCGVPVDWTTWFISPGLSMLMAASSGAVYATIARVSP